MLHRILQGTPGFNPEGNAALLPQAAGTAHAKRAFLPLLPPFRVILLLTRAFGLRGFPACLHAGRTFTLMMFGGSSTQSRAG